MKSKSIREATEDAWRNLGTFSLEAIGVSVHPRTMRQMLEAGLLGEPALPEHIKKARDGLPVSSRTLFGLPISAVAGLDPDRVYWVGRHHTVVAVTAIVDGRIYNVRK